MSSHLRAAPESAIPQTVGTVAWAAAIGRDFAAVLDGRRFVPADSECWCGERSRGLVDGATDEVSGRNVPAHLCLECNDDHCRHATLERRCEFALCTREAEVEIMLSDADTTGERVCALHVAPVINWGVIDVDECRIRPLPQVWDPPVDGTGRPAGPARDQRDNPPGSAHGAVA